MGYPPPQIFDGESDPDARTDVPAVVMTRQGPALKCAELRLTLGIRQGDREDLLLVMASPQYNRIFASFTPTTARALGQSMVDWASEREAAAGEAAAAAMARAAAVQGGE